MRNHQSAPLLLLPLFLSACANELSEQASAPPTVQVTEPSVAIQLGSGESVEIRWIANDPDSDAQTDIVAVRLADGLELPIADDVPELNGVEQSVTWVPTGGDAGLYSIEARVTDEATTTVAAAAGSVLFGQLDILETRAEAVFESGNAAHLAVQTDGSFAFGFQVNPNNPVDYLLAWPAPVQLFASGLSEVGLGFHAPDGTFRSVVMTETSLAGAGWQGDDDEFGMAYLLGLEPLPNGGFVAAMEFYGYVTVGVGQPGQATYASDSSLSSSSLLVAYDGFGQVLWSRQPVLGIEDADELQIAATPTGFALLMEIDEGTIVGPGDPNETTFPTYEDYMLSSWNTDGTLRYARALGDVSTAGGLDDAKLDAGPGGITVTSAFSDTVTFAPGTPEEVVLTQDPQSDDDTLTARFTLQGDFQWVQHIGGVISEFAPQVVPVDVAQLADGSCRVLVDFDEPGTYTIGPGEPGEVTVVYEDDLDLDLEYLVAYTAAGALDWAVRIEGLNVDDDDLGRIVELGSGDVWLCAPMDDEVRLFSASGQGVPDTLFAESTPGLGYLLVARFDSAGELVWALNDGGEAEPEVFGAARMPGDGAPQLLVFGNAYGGDQAEFGTNSPPTVALPSTSGLNLGLYAVYRSDGSL